jgi:hypothetical protein
VRRCSIRLRSASWSPRDLGLAVRLVTHGLSRQVARSPTHRMILTS